MTQRKASRYPPVFEERPTPGSADAMAIAAGVYRLQMPLDDDLEAINVWLLEDVTAGQSSIPA